MAEREKGVASAPCPSCGTDLNTVEQADGGLAFETCPNCYPTDDPAPEKASRPTRREAGTNVTGEEE